MPSARNFILNILLRQLALFGLLLDLAACIHGAAAAETKPGLTLTVVGQAVTVASKAHGFCDSVDIPDAPARAIRLVSGSVQLYAAHLYNRRFVGSDLLNVVKDCQIVLQGSNRDDPAAFDDRAWITSLYTPDGKTIFAALHTMTASTSSACRPART
jgi:hypothetical protein